MSSIYEFVVPPVMVIAGPNGVGKSTLLYAIKDGCGVLAILIIIGTFWYFWGGKIQMDTAKRLDNVYEQVSADSVQQYEIAKRQGDPMQTCVQAGFVAAAFLQEKNEGNYQQWKATEKSDCSNVGVSR